MATRGVPVGGTGRLAVLLAARPMASAAVLMILGCGLMSLQHAIVRYISTDIPTIETVFFRNLFGLVTLLPWLLRVGAAGLYTERFGLHCARAVCNTLSLIAFFAALGMITLAEATALNLTIPLFVCVGAVLLLGERVRPGHWLAVAIGLAGALIIIRPGLQAVTTGTLLVVAASVLAAGSRLTAKMLSGTDSSGTIVAWGALLMLPVAFVPALFVWVWPTFWQWPLLFAVGALGVCGQLCFVRAYSLVDLSVAEPIVFTRLLWASAIGYVWFGEAPDLWTWVGGALIVAGTTVIARHTGRGSAGG